ncbi:nitrous oxide reductase family maturation protein NosD [Myxococcota bacterium]|nr:nitrous oxide reductase family maturation protein NosD [Myxococcota bacterium]
MAAAAILAAWLLPWWVMEARAPQYGQRTLVVEVSPRAVAGDVFEVDTLGHYVGIRPMGTLAGTERALAPIGLGAAALGLLLAPWLRRRWMRTLAVLPAIVVPVFFVFDLQYWMDRATNERDEDAALNLTITEIETKLFGQYEIAQFKVTAKVGGGLYVAGLGSLLAIGLVFARPLPAPARRRKSASAAAAVTIAMAMPAESQATVHTIGPDGSLSAAVATASPGDEIRLRPGRYVGPVVVDRPLVLVGDPGAVLDGEGRGTVVRVTARDVVLRDLTIARSGDSYLAEDAGIRLERADGARVERVRIEDTLFGVFVVESNDCEISSSHIRGMDLPHERRGDGVRLWYSSRCRLTDNVVERSRDVVVWYSSDTVAQGNIVRHSRYGLHYMYSDRNIFRRNRFEDNQVGAAIMYSRGIELTENAFSFSDGPAAFGLLVKDADDVFIRENRFVRNDAAMFFDGAPQSAGGRVEVERNFIARNRVGIALLPLTRRLEVFENTFVGNDRHVEMRGSGNADGNVWSRAGRGNYWSNVTVWDPDRDGVSNMPVRFENLYEVLGDKYPVLAFFDGTPAASALDSAARLFPIFNPRPYLTDPHPLAHPALTAWTESREIDASAGNLVALGCALVAGGLGCAALGRGGVKA